MHPTLQRDIDTAEDRLSWLRGLVTDAKQLREGISTAVRSFDCTDAEMRDIAAGVDDVVGDLNGLVREAEDALYRAQNARVPRAVAEAAE